MPVPLGVRRFLRSAAIVARRQLHVSYPAPIQSLYRDSTLTLHPQGARALHLTIWPMNN